MATDKYYIELLIAPSTGLGVAVLNILFPELIRCSDAEFFISKTIDISFIMFGFLLTALTLLLQTSPSIKERKLFPRLIDFNKKVVLLSLVLGFYSLFYVSLFDTIAKSSFKEFVVSLFLFFFVFLFGEMIKYIRVFYKMINEGYNS